MRVVTELVGGIVLLLIFAYGVRETIRFFSTKELPNGNEHGGQQDSAAGNEPT